MRKLHVVGFTSDFDGLIFSTRKGSKSGSFVVSITDDLLEKVAEAERLRNGDEGERGLRGDAREPSRTRPQSELTPREIQSRLRAGRSIDEVAKEARAPREWVERFAAPVLAEQASVVELAMGLTYSKARLGESALPLGSSVALNLASKGLLLTDDEFLAGWSAFQVHDGLWMIRFRYRSRGRVHQAVWELDAAAGRLASRDRVASDLAYVDGRRRAAEEEEEPPAAPPVSTPRIPRSGTRAAGPVRAALPASTTSRGSRAEPSTPARRPATRKAAGRTTSGRKATAPRTRAAAKGPAGATKRATARRTPARPAATTTAANKRVPARARTVKAPAAKRGPATRTASKQTPSKQTPSKQTASKQTASRAASRRVAAPTRPAASAPATPRIGNDGSRLGPAVGSGSATGGRRPPASTRTAPRSPGGPTASGAAKRSPRPSPSPAPPSRPSPPRRASAPAPAAQGNGSQPRPIRFQPSPPPPREEGARRPPPRSRRASEEYRDLMEEEDIGPDIDLRGDPDDDAFVIRPRISAKQASELAFSEERPRRFRTGPSGPMTFTPALY